MSDYQGNIIIKNPATPTGPNQNGSAPGVWKLSEALSFIRQGIWPTQGVTGSDPYFNYVSMLLSTTSLGNANNNLFVDSSGAFNPISRNGNTTQGSATPYSANWSNYFDGSGDYLSSSATTIANFGTGDFTVECWVYSLATGQLNILDFRGTGGTGDALRLGQNGTTGKFTSGWGSNDNILSSTTNVILNQWVHIAVTRSGSTARMFINGVLEASATNSTSIPDSGMIVASYRGTTAFFNGYISNVRVLKGTALYTSSFTPPTAPLTAITNTSLLTCQSNRFRDASSNNFTITRNGDTRVTDFAPFSPGSPGISYDQSDITNWSGYFDGSGDFLSTPANAAFDFGTGDFAIECWVYRNNTTGTGLFESRGGSAGLLWYIDGTNQYARVYIQATAAHPTSTIAVPINEWVHLAVTRSSGVVYFWMNGQAAGSSSISTSIGSTATLRLGASNDGAQYNGYISNMRVVKGSAVYTSAFTPPTTNLSAISGTSLLTFQNAAFTDNSPNNFVLTPNGNVTVTGNSPFNTVGFWSNYFDGSSTFSFSSISLAADFTIEAWVYYTSTSGNPTLLGENPPNNQSLRRLSGKHYFYRQGASITGTIDIPTNQWVHLAATRSGGTVRIFTNGVLDGSGSISGAFSVNCFGGVDTGTDRLTGYASNVRIVDGTALYTATFTVPTSPLTAVSGTTLLTAQNGTFKDNSTNNRTLTRNGSPTVQSFDPFYTATIASNGGSMYFDGSADYIEPSWSSTSLPGSWTFECWFYATAASGMIFDCRPNSTNGYYPNVSIASSTQIDFYYNANSNFITVPGGTINKWIHLAVVKNGTSLVVYLDGVSSFSATDSNTWAIGASRPRIGANGGYYSAAPAPLTGYISNFRIINGTAAYTGAFTPPTAPTSPTPNTILMLNGMNAGIYDATAINDMETIGNAQVSTAVSKFGGSSLYFDGTGDYLSLPGGPQNYYGSGNFTIEGWFYFNATPSNMPLLGWGNTSYKVIRISTTSINVESDNPSNTSFNVSFNASKTLTTGTWYHIALVRSGNSFTAYVDGVGGTAYTSFTGNVGHASDVMYIGYKSDPTFFNGYIDDLRITNGYARYTSNFTPPTQAFPTF